MSPISSQAILYELAALLTLGTNNYGKALVTDSIMSAMNAGVPIESIILNMFNKMAKPCPI